MFLGLPFEVWLPWIIAFIALIADWWIGVVYWGREDAEEEKEHES